VGCSNRARDARAEHRYCGQRVVSRRSLDRLIGDFIEVLNLVEFGGEGGAVVH
jgi:hypothetical protein